MDALLSPEFLTRLETLSLRSRRMFRGIMRGERRSRQLGRGVEFSDYRSYQMGDDVRYIDWNVASRLDRLFVKLFSEDEDLDVHLLLDTSRSMGWGTPSKLAYAAAVAAAIAYIGLSDYDRVGVAACAGRVERALPLRRGRAQIRPLFDFLQTLAPAGRTDLGATLREYVVRTRRRGLLVLLSDLLDPRGVEDALKLARYQRFDPFVIHVLADEDLFPALDGDLRLVDDETGEGVEVSIDAAAMRAFADARDRYLGDLEAFCLHHQIEYMRATTSVPFEDLVLRYLRVGGLIA